MTLHNSPFSKHGIKHLSASSLNLHRNEPALWCLKYLMKKKDGVGPGAWRGSAVEAGLDYWLFKKDEKTSLQKAYERFELDAQGLAEDDVEKERGLIPAILNQAMEAFADLGQPVARQLKCETWLDGIEVPIIGFIDYVYPDFDVDLKTTLRLPSAPRPDHEKQVSLYTKARNKPCRLVYVTDKKHKPYPVENTDSHIRDLTIQARALRKQLWLCDSAQEFSEIVAPDFNKFYWNENTIKEANTIWNI